MEPAGYSFPNMLASSGVNGPSQIMRYDIGSGATNDSGDQFGWHKRDLSRGQWRCDCGGARESPDWAENRDQRRFVDNIDFHCQRYVTTSGSKAFNGPNDLVVDSTGGIYFTDPDYEGRHSLTDAFYYYSSGGVLTQLGTFGTGRPNGIVLSPDGSTLYWCWSSNSKSWPTT